MYWYARGWSPKLLHACQWCVMKRLTRDGRDIIGCLTKVLTTDVREERPPGDHISQTWSWLTQIEAPIPGSRLSFKYGRSQSPRPSTLATKESNSPISRTSDAFSEPKASDECYADRHERTNVWIVGNWVQSPETKSAGKAGIILLQMSCSSTFRRLVKNVLRPGTSVTSHILK